MRRPARCACRSQAVPAFEKVAANDKSHADTERCRQVRACCETLPIDWKGEKTAANVLVTIVRHRRNVRYASWIREILKEHSPANKARVDGTDAGRATEACYE